MAKVTNIFINGRMNSDTTYPLLDNKDYVRAENLRILGVGEDGRFNFMKGSEMVSDYSDEGQMTIIGMYEGADNILYYFLAQPNGKSRIVAYDVERKTSRLVIEDYQILRFDLIRWHQGQVILPYKYLLSINQIGDLLFISNEAWEYPRVINIKKDYSKGFDEEDIVLAKKPPKDAPDILSLKNNKVENSDNDIFVSFAYRYKYIDGDYSALSFYTDVAFEPKDTFRINSKREHTGMVNQWDYVKLGVMSGGKNVTDIEVYAREHGSNTAYLIYSANKAQSNIDDDTFIQDIEYKFSKNYEVLDEEHTTTLYSNVPKFPKSQTAVGNRIFFGNYKEGFDIDHPVDYEVKVYSEDPFEAVDRHTAVSLFKYKVGMVFYNDYNESTSVLLPVNQTKSEVEIGYDKRLTCNQLIVKMQEMTPPQFATKMKFVVKSEVLNYENLYVTYAKRIGEDVYLNLNFDNINRIKQGDVLIYTGDTNDKYREYIVEHVKEYAVDDGLSKKGIYAHIKDAEGNIKIKEVDGFSGVKEYPADVNMKIDTEVGTNPPSRFVSVGKSEGSEDGFWNMGYLNKGDFGKINEGDVIKISIDFLYYSYDTAGSGAGEKSHLGSVNITTDIYSEAEYANIYSLLLAKFNSTYIQIQQTQGSVLFRTTKDFPNLVKEKAGVAYEWKPHEDDTFLGTGKYVLTVKTKTVVTINRGVTPLIFRTKNKENIESLYFEDYRTFPIVNGKILGGEGLKENYFYLGFYNGYCWGNGVESYKIKDQFNGKALKYRFRGNLYDKKGYKRVHRKNDITYSGIYNYDLGINNLSMFNPSQANWLSLPIMNGEIQRVVSTEGNITAFQNNKIVDVYYGKSIIADLQGNENLALSKEVLGGYRELPYEYGISENPESVVLSGRYIYFTDKNRSRFLLKAGQEIKELNPPTSGIHSETVDLLKNHQSFLGSYDDAHGEYVVVVDNNFSLSYTLTSNGFTSYYTYKTDYNYGMNGKYFSSYKGRLYQNEVTETYNDFAGQGLHEAKLTFVVNPEITTDKVFKAIYLQSNTAWYTKVKTNLTATEFSEQVYEPRESYFYTEVQRDSSTPIGIVGVGRIKGIKEHQLIFSADISNQVSVGDTLTNEEASYESEITAIVGNTITVQDAQGFQLNDFMVTKKKQNGHFRPSGVPMRGEWMEVTLSKIGDQPYYIGSVSTEVMKSWL